jgi:4-carboxymuconolactone decarboxylase
MSGLAGGEGIRGAVELIYLVGVYCLVSITLNGFNVPVPESEAE